MPSLRSTPRQQDPDSVPPDPGGISGDLIADASYLRDVCVAIFQFIVAAADADAGGQLPSTLDVKLPRMQECRIHLREIRG